MSEQVTQGSLASVVNLLRKRVNALLSVKPDHAIAVNLSKLQKLVRQAEKKVDSPDLAILLAEVRSQVYSAEVRNTMVNDQVPDAIRTWPPTIQRAFLTAQLKIDEVRDLLSLYDLKLGSEYAMCVSGAVGRLEALSDSDLDHVLLFKDKELQKNYDKFVTDLNTKLYTVGLRPCGTFSCALSVENLAEPQAKFERYAIFTLLDSMLLGGDAEFYDRSLSRIESALGDHAANVDSKSQAAKTLGWYIGREGWVDELEKGSTVNRMTRLVQLFITILSLKHFGIRETRMTRPTWLRLDRVSDLLPLDQAGNARALWVRMLEMKENLGRIVLEDMATPEKLLTGELWAYCQTNYQI